MALDNKKKGLLFLIAGAVVFVVLLFVLLGNAQRKKAEAARQGIVNVTPEIPDADSEALTDSKLDAYSLEGRRRSGGRSNIDAYWDDIAGDEDPLDMLSDRGGTPARELTVEELFGGGAAQQEPVPAPAPAASAYDREQMMKDYMEMYQNIIAASMPQPEPEPEPELEPEPEPVDVIDVDRVQVRRGGIVSSMDDDFGVVGSSGGVSTLDGGGTIDVDEDYPFECMFVKTEKIKGTTRVPVRLLVDMVVGGQLVPKNTHLMATCTLGERLNLNIQSVEINGRLISLDYDAYDANDHARGIYCPVPDTQAKDQAKQQFGSSVLNVARSEVGRMAQDALQVGSIIMSQSGRDRSVTVPQGYRFYIVKSRRGR